MSLPALQFACGIGVRCNSDALLSGLLEHFSGWHVPAVRPRFWVSGECDADRYQELGRRVAVLPGRPRAVYALDTETVTLPAWRLDGTTVVFDEFCECYYLPAADRLTVLTHPAARLATLGLLRVVRELVCSVTRSGSTLDLHAAAVEIGGRAVVACGPKRAGKTSLLCQLLSSGQARYLANDRVRLAEHDAVLGARGIPTVVRLRPLTVESFPALRVEAAASFAPAAASAHGRPDAVAVLVAEELSLSPARLCARLGAEAGVEAPLGVVLHPRIVPEGPGWSLRALSRREALASLAAAIYGVARAEATLLEALLPAPARRSATDEARTMARLASRVPQYLCQLGPGAYAEPAGPLVAALGELCQSP